MQDVTYEFGPFRIDAASHRLQRDGELIPLKPKAFDLLALLVENSGRVMSKDELMRALWPDSIVEEASLTQNVYEVRRALSTGTETTFVETVPKRGYRFVARVRISSAAKTSIAVLPFRPPAGSAGPLEIGVAETIANALTRLRTVSVRATATTSRYAGSVREPLAIGRELGVALVVDGSIQTAGERVRITAQMLDVVRGTTIWGEQFDGAMTEIFALQDAIAARVAKAAGAGSLSDEALRRHPTESTEAYQLYMRGRYSWNKATPEGLAKSIELFRAAIDVDPRYALAWVGIADAYTSLDWYGVLSTRESNPHAMAAATRALDLDDSLAEAHASLGMARQYAWDWRGAESAYRTSIALRPDYAPARQWYGVFLAFMGRFEEAMSEMRVAQLLDPASLSIAAQTGLVLFAARRFDDARELLLQALRFDPESLEARFYLGITEELRGNTNEAIRIYEALPASNPDFRACLAHALATSGDAPSARAIVLDLESRREGQYVPPFWLALAWLGLNDHDSALSALERACDDPDDSLLAVNVFPLLDPIRSHPRFHEVLRRMQLLPATLPA